jgi:hypothetical protein
MQAPLLVCPFIVSGSPKDVYWASFHTSGTSASTATVASIDGVTSGTVSTYDSAQSGAGVVDAEHQIGAAILPGLHWAQIKSTGSTDLSYVFYIRVRKRQVVDVASSSGLSLPEPWSLNAEWWSLTPPATMTSLRAIPTSQFLGDQTLTVDAQLVANSGIFVLGTRKVGTIPWPGYLIYMDGTGALHRAEGTTSTSVANDVTLDAADRSGRHTFRFVLSKSASTVTTYMDGTQIDSYTLTRSHRGGFLGLWTRTGTHATVYSAILAR